MPAKKQDLRLIMGYSLLAIIVPLITFSSLSAKQDHVGANATQPCLENRIIEAANLIMKAKTRGVDPTSLAQLQFKLNETVAALNRSSISHSSVSCLTADNHPEQSTIINLIAETAEQLMADKDRNLDSNGFSLQVSPALGLIVVPAGGIVTALTFETVRRMRLRRYTNDNISSVKRNKSSESRRQVFTVLICSTMIYSLIFFVAMNPRQENHFYTLSVLDSNHKTNAYYPTTNGSVSAGENVSWLVEAEGNMIPAGMVKITVGVAGSPTSLATDFPESDVKTLTEFYHVAQNKETWQLPLNWRIVSAYRSESGVSLCMDLNGNNTNTIFKSRGDNQRLVVGLWAFDSDQGNYRLESWLQMWFKIPSYNSMEMQVSGCE